MFVQWYPEVPFDVTWVPVARIGACQRLDRNVKT